MKKTSTAAAKTNRLVHNIQADRTRRMDARLDVIVSALD